MAKSPPAFQFYAVDFQQATNTWTPSEVGVYMRLLTDQWINGPLPGDMGRLCRVAGCSEKELTNIFEVLSCKFVTNGAGRIYNPRLEQVRADQKKYSESRAKNGLKGGRPKKHMV